MHTEYLSRWLRRDFLLARRLAMTVMAVIVCAGTARAESSYEVPYTFTKLAGASSIGSANGPGANARFYWAQSLVVDAAGSVFVTDTGNHVVRRITPAGVTSVFAGLTGVGGSVDGTGDGARFDGPAGLAIDQAGNLYVSDAASNVIRRITPEGVVSTLAGSAGVAGHADGSGADARFDDPMDLAIDGGGNLYVADFDNATIRKITPAGDVTTLAGSPGQTGYVDGTGSEARFTYIRALAIDDSGSLFAVDEQGGPSSDSTTYRIRRIGSDGTVSTVKSYLFSNPYGPWIDGLRGLVFDAAGNRYEAIGPQIRRVAPDGTITIVAGGDAHGFVDGTAASASFTGPTSMAFDPSGNLFVVDAPSNTVRKISSAGNVSTFAGLAILAAQGSTDGTGSNARFNAPEGIARAADGTLFVADHDNYVIRRITPAGETTTLAGLAGQSGTSDGTGSGARFLSPTAVAVDADGNVFVGEVNGAVRKVTPAGVVTTVRQFESPGGLAISSSGELFVADYYAHVIYRVSSAGVATVFAGAVDHPGYVDGTGAIARFRYPHGLAFDGSGNLYVADTNNHRIRRITPAGAVTTIAGGEPGSDDGVGTDARFFFPSDVSVDGAGNIYVADAHNQLIRRITPAGVVTTVAGLVGDAGFAEGTGSAARLRYPEGIVAAASGDVYVTTGTVVTMGVPAGRPVITTQPESRTVTAGADVQFSVAASGDPAPTYQWYRADTAIAGASAATLTRSNVQAADAGDYYVTVTNSLGSATSAKATLTVNALAPSPTPTPTPPAGGSGGGSGGGAPSHWFLVILAAAGSLRYLRRRGGAGQTT